MLAIKDDRYLTAVEALLMSSRGRDGHGALITQSGLHRKLQYIVLIGRRLTIQTGHHDRVGRPSHVVVRPYQHRSGEEIAFTRK